MALLLKKPGMVQKNVELIGKNKHNIELRNT